MKFIVDRKTWLKGEGSEKSFLLRAVDQKMCCLGFLAMKCGIDEKDIEYVTDPWEGGLWPKRLIHAYYTLSDIISVNDTENGNLYHSMLDKKDIAILNDAAREEFLKNLFKSIDIDVEFIN